MASESAFHIPIPSGSYTASQNYDIPVNCRSLKVILNMTNVGAGPSVTLTIRGKDPASGAYDTLLAGSAITTVSENIYKVSPHLAAAANSVAQDLVPPIINVLVTANNANAGTYSVSVLECV